MRKQSKTSLTNKLDKIVSEVVRARGYCVKCGQSDTLQCCHIFSRSNRSVRWDLNNLLCLCAKDHFWSHKNPILFTEFVREYLGELKYTELKIRANQIKKWEIYELEELYQHFKEIK